MDVGDAGGGVNAAAPKLEIAPGPLAGPIATQAVWRPSLSPFGMVDVGAGYQATSWFRADATIEYRFGASLRSGATDAWAGSAQTGNAFRADAASFVGLVNGVLIARFKVPAFVASLGVMYVARGAALLIIEDGGVVENVHQQPAQQAGAEGHAADAADLRTVVQLVHRDARKKPRGAAGPQRGPLAGADGLQVQKRGHG